MKREQLSLKSAEAKDCQLLWKLKNEKGVRKNSFDSRFVPYEEHKRWFEQKLKSPNTNILILLDSFDKEIGQIRFDKNQGISEISFSVEKEKRGYGYGTQGLKLACEYVFCNFNTKMIVAHVKIDNKISKKVFEKIGFKNNGKMIFKKQSCYEFSLKDGLNV